jgi:tRNA/rRNA methyltransferase
MPMMSGREVKELEERYLEAASRLVVVLVGTRGALNLGSSARAMANFGVSRLRLVRPETEIWCDESRAMAMEAQPLLAAAEVYDDLASAVADCQYVFATTRRVGRRRKAYLGPPDMARMLQGLDPGRGAAIVFGPENFGLSTEDIHVCNAIVTLKTGAPFNSLNLSQAVLLMLYEVHRSFMDTDAGYVADLERIEELLDHTNVLLRGIKFIEGADPEQTITRLRRLAMRARPTYRESRLLHAIMGHIGVAAGINKKNRKTDT